MQRQRQQAALAAQAQGGLARLVLRLPLLQRPRQPPPAGILPPPPPPPCFALLRRLRSHVVLGVRFGEFITTRGSQVSRRFTSSHCGQGLGVSALAVPAPVRGPKRVPVRGALAPLVLRLALPALAASVAVLLVSELVLPVFLVSLPPGVDFIRILIGNLGSSHNHNPRPRLKFGVLEIRFRGGLLQPIRGSQYFRRFTTRDSPPAVCMLALGAPVHDN